MATNPRALQPLPSLLKRTSEIWPLVLATLLLGALMFLDIDEFERRDDA